MLWVLIADAAHARIYSMQTRESSPHLLRRIEHPLGRAKAHEILSDAPGRYRESGKGSSASAMDSANTMHQVEENRFAHELADDPHKGLEQGQFNQLAIFAPAQLLGMLRQRLNAQVDKAVFFSSAKDLTTIPERDLPEHFIREFLS